MVATTEVYMEKQEKESLSWFKNHADAISIITTIIVAVFWMTSTINSFDSKLNGLELRLGNRIGNVEKDIAIIKTVLVMKGMLPPEMASAEKK